MNLQFQKFRGEVDHLVRFLTSQSWDYHSVPKPGADQIRKLAEKGYYHSRKNITFWIQSDSGEKMGLFRIYDVEDSTPMFDIRILNLYRKRGIGERAVRWMTRYVFTQFPHTIRFEGHTRQDNYPMRKVLHKCGFVKEAYHRQAWPSVKGKLYDSVGYAITREDWEHHKRTPVVWDDWKY